MNVKANSTTTKLTKLTGSQVGALEGHGEELKVDAGKSTATFEGTAAEALARLIKVQNDVAAQHGRGHSFVRSTVAVVHKLERMIAEEADAADAEGRTEVKVDDVVVAETKQVDAAPKLTLVADSTDRASLTNIPGLDRAVTEKQVEAAQEAATEILAGAGYTSTKNSDGDTPTWGTAKHHGLKDGDMLMFYGQNPKAPKKSGTVRKYETKNGSTTFGGVATKFWAAPITRPETAEKPASTKKAAPAKAGAGSRAIPQEAANKARAKWIADNGLETYKKQYNGGWDNATYNTGEKKAKSGEASPAWMDGYTDRIANPGKEGIKSKWAALKSDKAPVAKI